MNELERAIELLRAGGYHVNAFDETDSRGVAFLLGWTVAYLSNRRSAGSPLPPGYRFGRTWLYAIGGVIEFRRVRKPDAGESSQFTT